MKRIFVALTAFSLFTFALSESSAASEQDFIGQNGLKVFVGQDYKAPSCLPLKAKSQLQLKINGKWKTKAEGVPTLNKKVCGSEVPYLLNYRWTIDEFGEENIDGSQGKGVLLREFVPGTPWWKFWKDRTPEISSKTFSWVIYPSEESLRNETVRQTSPAEIVVSTCPWPEGSLGWILDCKRGRLDQG